MIKGYIRKKFSFTLDNAFANDNKQMNLKSQLSLKGSLLCKGWIFPFSLLCLYLESLLCKKGLKVASIACYKIKESITYMKGSG